MTTPRILVAGIGNIFLGDDAFGCEVARRLCERTWPPDVRVVDFGIRGFDLATALMESCEAAVLIDALPGTDAPGTLRVIEPTTDDLPDAAEGESPVQAHAMHPVQVFRLVKVWGGELPTLRLVGCQPAEFGSFEEGRMGLSPVVSAAVERAVPLVVRIVDELRASCGTPDSPVRKP